jgi:hypothetical protein
MVAKDFWCMSSSELNPSPVPVRLGGSVCTVCSTSYKSLTRMDSHQRKLRLREEQGLDPSKHPDSMWVWPDRPFLGTL